MNRNTASDIIVDVARNTSAGVATVATVMAIASEGGNERCCTT